jgi:hypothetical protein
VRVTHAPASSAERRRIEERRSFDAALARARSDREGRGTRRAEGPVVPRRKEPSARSSPAGPGGARPQGGSPSSALGAPPLSSGSRTPVQHGAAPALPELREAARAVPTAIWAGRLQGAAVVELAFGRELSVELRQGAGGIEIAVRTDAALARAARADLPALVQALRARGVEVARAEVLGGERRAISAQADGRRAVDARPPLR